MDIINEDSFDIFFTHGYTNTYIKSSVYHTITIDNVVDKFEHIEITEKKN